MPSFLERVEEHLRIMEKNKARKAKQAAFATPATAPPLPPPPRGLRRRR